VGPGKRKKTFEPRSDGTFGLNLTVEMRQFLVDLADSVEEVVDQDIPETTRLFPTAYPHDPEKDAGYQVFARDQLIEQRKKAVAVLRKTVDDKTVTEEQLVQWLGVVNDARLVIGTHLDVSEDDELELDDPDFEMRLVYEQLGYLVDRMVKALATALPESSDSGDESRA
jgi:hypothetical protein